MSRSLSMVIGSIVIVAFVAVIVVLSAYFKPTTNFIKPDNNETSKTPEGLILPGSSEIAIPSDPSLWAVVNKEFPLDDSSYRPDDLIVPDLPVNQEKTEEERMVRQLIVGPLTGLINDAKSAGHEIFIASAFRSFELQNMYYTNYVKAYGQSEADMFSAKPGSSEHQTGLAVDLSLLSRQCYLETCFGDTDAGQWLANNAVRYGFIIRYPQNKTDITGYQFEPWHFRFVDKDLASALQQSGLTLDEAQPYIKTALSQISQR